MRHRRRTLLQSNAKSYLVYCVCLCLLEHLGGGYSTITVARNHDVQSLEGTITLHTLRVNIGHADYLATEVVADETGGLARVIAVARAIEHGIAVAVSSQFLSITTLGILRLGCFGSLLHLVVETYDDVLRAVVERTKGDVGLGVGIVRNGIKSISYLSDL